MHIYFLVYLNQNIQKYFAFVLLLVCITITFTLNFCLHHCICISFYVICVSFNMRLTDHHVYLTTTTVELGTQKICYVTVGCLNMIRRENCYSLENSIFKILNQSCEKTSLTVSLRAWNSNKLAYICILLPSLHNTQFVARTLYRRHGCAGGVAETTNYDLCFKI
jgi:hypothetical protein